MADTSNFKHISVNPEEEDDVIIHAGLSTQQEPSAPEQESADVEITQEEQAEKPAANEAASPAQPQSEPEPSSTPEPATKQAVQKNTEKKPDKYEPTTLEDISDPMPTAQKIVIGIAIVGIIVIIFYLVQYFFVMG